MKILFITLFATVLSAPILEEELNLPGFINKEESHEQKFIRSDGNKNKELTFDEFLHMELAYVSAKREEFDSLDKNHDGILSLNEYEEHYHGVNSRSAAIRAEYFGKVFDEFDENLDKALNQDELERVLQERFMVRPRENFPKIFYSFDLDHNGSLDIHEYTNFDGKFPFEQTDPIRAPHPNQQPKKDATPPDADMAAVRQVLAQSGRRF